MKKKAGKVDSAKKRNRIHGSYRDRWGAKTRTWEHFKSLGARSGRREQAHSKAKKNKEKRRENQGEKDSNTRVVIPPQLPKNKGGGGGLKETAETRNIYDGIQNDPSLRRER